MTIALKSPSVDSFHRLLGFAILGMALLWPSPGLGQSSRLSKDDIALIKTAETPEDLVELAKLFALQQKTAAAAFCIEKACEAKPELLTDDTLDTSSTWNTVWFSERGKIRLQQLDKDDVEGRLELARWLHHAGVHAEARARLEEALKIDKDHPQALALARQWHLSGDGPVRFDLRLGLAEPLLRDSIQDEGQVDEARRGKQYLLVPIQCQPRERALSFNRTDLKATFNDGSTGSSKGIVLLERGGARRTASPSSEEISLNLQSEREPIWERLIVAAPEPDGPRNPDATDQDGETTYSLTCYNTTHPRTVDRSSGSSGRSRSSSDRGQPNQERSGSGFAAFILEVPEDMTFADCVLDDRLTIHLEKRFLLALKDEPAGSSSDPVPEDPTLINDLLGYLTAEDGEVARAAVLRLASIHKWLTDDTPIPAAGSPQDPALPPIPPLLDRVDRAMIQAISHSDGATSQAAFTVLIDTETPLHPEMIRHIAQSDPKSGMTVLEQIDALLADRPPGTETPGYRSSASGTRSPGDGSSGDMVAGLPVSAAPRNVFSILSASLSSPHAELREKALRICRRDGSQQSILILNQLGSQSNDVLVQEMERVEDPQLKSTILRVLVLSAEEESLPKLLKSCEDLTLHVKSGADPLLARLTRLQTAEAAVPLLALFTRARFDEGVAESPELRQTLSAIPEPLWKVPQVQAELYKLCAYPLRPEYVSPVNYDRSGPGAGRAGGQGLQAETAFEDVLTRLALLPEGNAQVVDASALQLVSSGRISLLNQGLSQESTSSDRRLAIVRRIAGQQDLWPLDATPSFLTARLTDPDEEAIRVSLAFLLEISRRLEEDEAWKFYFAVKRTASRDQLLTLTGHQDNRISELASQLLPRLALMTKEDAEQFKRMLSESERKAALEAQNEKLGQKPAGPFMAAVRLELVSTVASSPSNRSSQGGGTNSVLLTAGKGTFESSNRNEVRVVFDRKDLADTRSSENPASTPNSLTIEATPLIRAALAAPKVEESGLARRLDVSFLSEPLTCPISHDSLGTWTGTVQIPATGGSPGQPVTSSLRVNHVQIILESLAPQSTF